MSTYAPSRYLADYFSRVHDMNIAVIRPPKLVEIPERCCSLSICRAGFLFTSACLWSAKGWPACGSSTAGVENGARADDGMERHVLGTVETGAMAVTLGRSVNTGTDHWTAPKG